jgi:diguanylate cyclase (GGDEF)-like protein/PAS domain S-box-containing protein
MANSNPASPVLFGRNFPSSTTHDTKPSKKDKHAWKLMVIDDEESVHQVTRMVLEDLTYDGRGLAILNGYSGEDARRLMSEHPDTAVLLLDVVMETDNAGLDVVDYIRNELGNQHVRIILRTGQPGEAPEADVIQRYDINDYKEKADLTAEKLNTSIIAALRAYNDLLKIEELALSKSNLEKRVRERTREVLKINQDLEKEIQEREHINQELRQSETRLAQAQRIANIGNWEWDLETNVVTWSDQVHNILGLQPGAFPVSYDTLINLVIGEEVERVKAAFENTLRTGEPYDFEHAINHTDGSLRYLHQQGQVEFDEDGVAVRLIGTLQNVTERRVTDLKMRKLSGAIEQIADSVMITDCEGIIEYINPAFEKMTGYTAQEVLGCTPNILKTDKQSNAFYKRMWHTILRGDVFSDVIINRKKNGDLYYEEKTITPQHDSSGKITHFISTGKDITDRMAVQERLHFLAHHDALTGLPNRVLLLDRLNQAIKRARWRERNIAVMFLDLDRFKVINDSLGHDVGDQLLQVMSQRLLEGVREGDTVARLGGDEFAVILNDLAMPDDIPPIAEKILKIMSDPFVIDDNELFVTSSIGISLYPTDSEDAQSLIKKADIAMYQAKASGKNNYHFYRTNDDATAVERLSLETRLRRALDRNEFFIEYQPQFNLFDGRIIGAEALLRWRNSDFETIAPIHFVPLLEETGMIIPVGEWVLRTACAQATIWHESGMTDQRISVNLSIRQFQANGMVKRLEEILDKTGLAPEYLELEVTEGLLIEQISETSKILAELHEMGVKLSIDDFGTGYSSLNYLKRLPFDTLKIDRSFVSDVTTSSDDAAIAAAIITLAHSLDLRVIGEGVETSEQLEFLQKFQCDAVQGFLYSPPVSPETIYVLDKTLANGRGLETTT